MIKKKKKGCIKRNMHNLRTECFILSITYVDTICSFTFQINVFHSKPFCHSFSPSSRPINLSNFYLSPYFHLFQKRTTINSFFFKNMIIRFEASSPRRGKDFRSQRFNGEWRRLSLCVQRARCRNTFSREKTWKTWKDDPGPFIATAMTESTRVDPVAGVCTP